MIGIQASSFGMFHAMDLKNPQQTGTLGVSPCFRRITLAKKTLITGITGQDGSYLAELLLK